MDGIGLKSTTISFCICLCMVKSCGNCSVPGSYWQSFGTCSSVQKHSQRNSADHAIALRRWVRWSSTWLWANINTGQAENKSLFTRVTGLHGLDSGVSYCLSRNISCFSCHGLARLVRLADPFIVSSFQCHKQLHLACFPFCCRSCFQAVLKISKFMLTVVGYSRLAGLSAGSPGAIDAEGNVIGQALDAATLASPSASASSNVLRSALEVVPNPTAESWMRLVAKRLAMAGSKEVSRCLWQELLFFLLGFCSSGFSAVMISLHCGAFPELAVVTPDWLGRQEYRNALL